MQKSQILTTFLDAVGLCVYANDLDAWSDWFKNKIYRKDFWIFSGYFCIEYWAFEDLGFVFICLF